MDVPLTLPSRAEDVQRLLEEVRARTGCDFRDYTPSALRRRLQGLGEPGELLERLGTEPEVLDRLLGALCLRPAAFFRDPAYFLALRTKVAPWLRTHPSVRLWVPGCSTGEEVYSLAIVLHEEGLLPRARIYGTHMSEPLLDSARAAEYPLEAVGRCAYDYGKGGGLRSLTDYFMAREGRATVRPELRERILFSRHSMMDGASFNEFQAIVCRDVLVDFRPPLQERVRRLFTESLCPFGVLCLGQQDPVPEPGFQELDGRARVYRRRQ
jgi:chemotaxis protein methyltransferase CheR